MLLYKFVEFLNANYVTLLRSSAFSKESTDQQISVWKRTQWKKDKADAHESMHRNDVTGFPRCELVLYTTIPTYVLLAIIYKIN